MVRESTRVIEPIYEVIPQCFVARYPHYPAAPFPMCFTRLALDILLLTVGRKDPETGAKGFSPLDRFGFDVIEYDRKGSEAHDLIMYTPNANWGLRRLTFHLNAAKTRVWSGDIHSHPGGLGTPSSEEKLGHGDLGYVHAFFEQNEWAEWFLLPILTHTGPAATQVVLHPWVCKRANPVDLFTTDVRVCNPNQFPRREFNVEYERRQSQ